MDDVTYQTEERWELGCVVIRLDSYACYVD